MRADEDALALALEPLFQWLVRLERKRESKHDADTLYRQCCQEVETFRTQARDAQGSLTSEDVELALYAWVAVADELAMNQEGPLKDHWQARLLQVRYLNENVAGEGFFERLTGLRNQPKRAPVLRVYYLCLLFGFRGKYRIRGSELELLEITETVRAELERARAIPKELVLSPSGRRPYERITDSRKNQLLFGLATAAALASALLYIGLRLALQRDTDLLVEQLTTLLGA